MNTYMHYIYSQTHQLIENVLGIQIEKGSNVTNF